MLATLTVPVQDACRRGAEPSCGQPATLSRAAMSGVYLVVGTRLMPGGWQEGGWEIGESREARTARALQ